MDNLIPTIMIVGEQQRQIDSARSDNANLRNQYSGLANQNGELQQDLNRRQEKIEGLRLVNEILNEKISNLEQAYAAQSEMLAEWMVSQKAFKELAIQFGLKKGLSADEIIQLGLEKEIDVLENKHNPEHKTNVGNSQLIGPHVEKLKAKYRAEKNQ